MTILLSILYIAIPIVIIIIFNRLRDSAYFSLVFIPTAFIYFKLLENSVSLIQGMDSNMPMVCLCIGALAIPYYLGYLFIKKMRDSK